MRRIESVFSILILLAFFTLAIIQLGRSVNIVGWVSPDDLGQDRLSVYLQRFEPMRDTLGHHELVGYIGDGGSVWFQAQYSLVPTIVAGDQTLDLVLGDFVQDSSENRTWADENLQLVKDVGNGVMLFRRREP